MKTSEYLELKKNYESLRIEFQGLQMEFDLVVKKLKVKYKITKKDLNDESEDIKNIFL